MNQAQAEFLASDVHTVAGNHAAVAAFIACRKNGYDLTADAQRDLAAKFAALICSVMTPQDSRMPHVPMSRTIDRRKPRVA